MFLEMQSLKAFRSNFYKNRWGTIFFSWFMLLKVYINIRCLEKSCLYFKLFCRRVELVVGCIFSDITEKHQAGEGILNSSNAWHPEAVAQRCSIKEVFLKVSQNSLENTCARVSFLLKLQTETCNFIKKEILAQVLSCKFCKISTNTFS